MAAISSAFFTIASAWQNYSSGQDEILQADLHNCHAFCFGKCPCTDLSFTFRLIESLPKLLPLFPILPSEGTNTLISRSFLSKSPKPNNQTTKPSASTRVFPCKTPQKPQLPDAVFNKSARPMACLMEAISTNLPSKDTAPKPCQNHTLENHIMFLLGQTDWPTLVIPFFNKDPSHLPSSHLSSPFIPSPSSHPPKPPSKRLSLCFLHGLQDALGKNACIWRGEWDPFENGFIYIYILSWTCTCN